MKYSTYYMCFHSESDENIYSKSSPLLSFVEMTADLVNLFTLGTVLFSDNIMWCRSSYELHCRSLCYIFRHLPCACFYKQADEIIVHQPDELLDNMNEWCTQQHGKVCMLGVEGMKWLWLSVDLGMAKASRYNKLVFH